MVEVEVFDFCNRTCWFCPNSVLNNRRGALQRMNANTYTRLLKELRDGGFKGIVSFSRYNEPFADDVIFEKISEAKRVLPDSLLHTNTNGDYLNRVTLERAQAAGLRSLNIQLYTDSFDIGEIREVKRRITKKCNLNTCGAIHTDDWVEWSAAWRGMSIRLYARDFRVNGTDRGGVLGLNQAPRTRPCFMSSESAFIDWNGSVMPCCDTRSDVVAHSGAVLGNINEDSLQRILNSERAADFRYRTRCGGEGMPSVCKTCSRK